MARYKLENALRGTEAKEFDSDEQAWNTLRQTWKNEDGSIRGVFIWMWKQIELEVPVNNEESYVEKYNHNYGPRPIGYGSENAKLMKVGQPNVEKVWIPVLRGITSDPYSVSKKKKK